VLLDDGACFKIRISDKVIPQIRISPDFGAAKKKSEFAKAAISQAKIFLEGIEYRENTIAKAACAIVQRQIEFFKNGPGNIVPLKQQDIAAIIGVHESTVSRMASSKYLQCQWGVFPIKYFFSSAVADSSKESAQYQLQKILEENPHKKLSDQKLADALAQRGIKIARRTVAKYRSQMNIESSYSR
ncbi:MAG: RNA polymerase sigma-54 factor, partial [Treponema sp.]|nr:RNA polymerase sigma-54 factor [Treponema sp.]